MSRRWRKSSVQSRRAHPSRPRGRKRRHRRQYPRPPPNLQTSALRSPHPNLRPRRCSIGGARGAMEKRCPDCGGTLPQGVPVWVRHLKVADAMTPDPLTMGPEDSLNQAVQVMRKAGIRRLPIVVADTLVGILAQGDLNRAQPSILSESQDEFLRVMEETPVSRIMIQNPVTVSEETPL